MTSISLSEKRVEELELLSSLPPEKLQAVAEELGRIKEIFLDVEEFSAFVGKYLDDERASLLVTHALSIRRLVDKHQISEEKVLEEIDRELKEHDWSADQLSKWALVREPIKRIITNEKLEIVTKASDLYFRHLNHFHDIRIITEVRPVFNEHRNQIVGGIVDNKMFITYSDGNENEKSIEISISCDELRRLKEIADRAILKTEVTTEFLESSKLKTRVYDSDW